MIKNFLNFLTLSNKREELQQQELYNKVMLEYQKALNEFGSALDRYIESQKEYAKQIDKTYDEIKAIIEEGEKNDRSGRNIKKG